MKLRTRLFLSIGLIFLIISILSYVLPHFLVKSDIEKTGEKIKSAFEVKEEEAYIALLSLIKGRFDEIESGLNTLGALIQTSPDITKEFEDNFFQAALKVFPYNIDLSFIQSSKGKSLVSPSNRSIPFEVNHQKNQIIIDSHVYSLKAADGGYLLYEAKEVMQMENPKNLSLKREAALWMMETFIPFYLSAKESKPDGFFRDDKFVLAQDLLTPLVFENVEENLVEDKKSGDLFLLSKLELKSENISLGARVSTMVQEIAKLLGKDLILRVGRISKGFDRFGKSFTVPPDSFENIQDKRGYLPWKGQEYAFLQIELDEPRKSDLFILTPPEQTISMLSMLSKMQTSIVRNVSMNLLGASLFCLGLALILLEIISKKITNPISELANATTHLEKGTYEDINLPKLEMRNDEVAALAKGFDRMVDSLKEREKIRGVLNKVVSKEIAAEILKGTIELGGEERLVTTLFSDIRGFTKMSEKMEPKTVLNLMNTYLTEVCRIIDENGGVVDKFVGDEVMALYGAPLDDKNQALKAVKTALSMIASLKKTNEKRAAKGLPPVEIGIGIHTGLVVAGNVGSENRLNYTVLGANVNLPARLCSAAKGMQILISESTLNEPGVKEAFIYEELAPLQLKGISEPVKVYSIISVIH